MQSAKSYIILILLAIFLLETNNGISQNRITLDGYLNDMQNVYRMQDDQWIWENIIHNRMNLNFYPVSWFTASVQARTRLIQGSSYSILPGYIGLFGKDGGAIDLSFALDGKYNDQAGYIFSSTLDRAYAEFSFGNFVGTIGRQRINWAQTLVWNPNDIFNSYSYFDVDYPERPGADAVRLQYYTSSTSQLEVAASIDSSGHVTSAGYYRFNLLGYDFQILSGILREEDFVFGAGWSGNIASTSFRGEFSYFRNLDSFRNDKGKMLISAGFDHTFGNGLWLQSEMLYSGFAKSMTFNGFTQLFSGNMSVKRIGFTEWSLFAGMSYPITPLINLSLSGMYFPDWKGFYIGPSGDFSIMSNLKFSIIFQAFSAKMELIPGDPRRMNTMIGYARLKWSF